MPPVTGTTRRIERLYLWCLAALKAFGGFASRWMDGSLFFRAVTGCMDFIRRVFAGSFIAGLFIADYQDSILPHSRFVRWIEKALNIIPKKITAPAFWPKGLSNTLSGSALINTACDALDTPVPSPAPAHTASGFWRKTISPVLQWAIVSLPIWGLLAVMAGAPFLPTMPLAGGIVVVTAFIMITRRFTVDLTSAFILLFIIVTLFFGLTSFAPSSSTPIALLTSAFMFSYLVVTACCTKQRQIDAFFFAFALSAGGTGLIGLYQVVTKKVDLTWVDVDLFTNITFRAYASFGNPNVYGTYLLLAVPLCAALVLYVKKPLFRLAALGVTGLLLVSLFLTYSRGCYLALAVAAFVFILLMEKRLIVFFLAGLPFLFFMLPPSMIDRLMSITNLSDSSISYRLSIWQGTLRILKDFWMSGLGQGIDAYNAVYPFYAFNAIIAPHSHNLFLQIFVETGIVGLLVFLGVLACFFRNQARFMRRTTDFRKKVMSAAITAAVIGFLFQGMTDYVFYNYRVMLTFFLFLGLGGAFTRLETTPENTKTAGTP